MRVGYIRVSAFHQNSDRQEESLGKMNVEKLFIEHANGKDRKRPQLDAMLKFVQPGDVVVIYELSMMARSAADLYSIVKELNEKEVGLESLTEDIDVSSGAEKLTLGSIAVMARLERDLYAERQREGIAAAKAKGKRWGRENIYGTDERLVHEVFSNYYAKKISYIEASERLGMKRSTFYYRYSKWMNSQREAGLLKEKDS